MSSLVKETIMAKKQLQFVVTVEVDVADDWEAPTYGTDAIENALGGALYHDRPGLANALEAESIGNVSVVFETITD